MVIMARVESAAAEFISCMLTQVPNSWHFHIMQNGWQQISEDALAANKLATEELVLIHL